MIAAFAVSGTAKSFAASSAKRIDLSGGPIEPGAGTRTALFFISSHTMQTVKRPAAGHVGHGRKTAALAKLDGRTNRIAARQSKQAAPLPRCSVHRRCLLCQRAVIGPF